MKKFSTKNNKKKEFMLQQESYEWMHMNQIDIKNSLAQKESYEKQQWCNKKNLQMKQNLHVKF